MYLIVVTIIKFINIDKFIETALIENYILFSNHFIQFTFITNYIFTNYYLL